MHPRKGQKAPRKNSWCKVSEIVLGGDPSLLGGGLGGEVDNSSGGGASTSPRAFLPAAKRRNSKGKALSQDEVAKLSPLTPMAPKATAPNVVLDAPSPRAGRNQKQKVPTLKLSSTPPRLKEKVKPSEPFKHLLYEQRNFTPHKALGMSVSMDGDIFVPRPVRDAWSSMEGIEGEGDTGRDVQVDRVTAVRISEEYERAQARKDREQDIYYQYYCKETAKKIEDGRQKAERAWSKDIETNEMARSGSCFLSFGGPEGDSPPFSGPRSAAKIQEEVERMRRRLLRNVAKEADDMRVVSESDTEADGGPWAKPMDIDIPSDSDKDTMTKDASARKNADLKKLIGDLGTRPTPTTDEDIGAFLRKSLEAGMRSGFSEIGFIADA
mmetsp:Transcript_26333/g.52518  ORF Transcript_26333/g.52518 Transcript_26333/m.52518 type:complete len:381 (+) Transcript_26333:259-1401(+)